MDPFSRLAAMRDHCIDGDPACRFSRFEPAHAVGENERFSSGAKPKLHLSLFSPDAAHCRLRGKSEVHCHWAISICTFCAHGF